MSENQEPSSRTRFGRTRRVSAVPRSVVLGIDDLERRISFIAGGLAMALAVIISPHLFHNTWVTDTAKPSASGKCATLYKLVRGTCDYRHLTHPSDWVLQFSEIVVIGAFIIFFAYRRKRAGVATAGLLFGLAQGIFGLPFLFLGGWLIVRALRLQKYGDPTFSGSTKRAREIAKEKREGRPVATKSKTKGSSSKSTSSSVPTPPAPSKRYTPKQRPRRR